MCGVRLLSTSCLWTLPKTGHQDTALSQLTFPIFSVSEARLYLSAYSLAAAQPSLLRVPPLRDVPVSCQHLQPQPESHWQIWTEGSSILDFIPESWKRYWNQTCQSVLTPQWSPAHWGFMLHFSLGTNPRMTLLGSIITLYAVGAMGSSGNGRFLFVLWLLLHWKGCESKLSLSS